MNSFILNDMNGPTNKPALRSEIEKVLDDLISNEEGMNFQGLATVFAKQRWPGMVACERKNDLGIDAHLSASIAPDGIGKGLACSITAEIGKISKDAQKIKQNYPDVSVLLFATPRKVSNPNKKKWAEKIKEAVGLELQVSSREDLIISLMMPENASLCRSFLGIEVSIDPTLNEVLLMVRKAATDFSTSLATRKSTSLIELSAARSDEDGKAPPTPYTLADLQHMLLQSHRIILEAPAGSGKTTTLAQLSDAFLKTNGIAFLVDIPTWVSSGSRLLEFITASPEFLGCGVDVKMLMQVRGAEKFVFLLNGWNEITDSQSTFAANSLRDLERMFPDAGIIVATRTHHIPPPLPGALRIRLFPLSHKQRRMYIAARLGQNAGELFTKITSDSVLDELTQTPLILVAVTLLFEAGKEIPKAKMGILASFIRHQEQLPEHSPYIGTAPLRGLQSDYLVGLAAHMTAAGLVTVQEKAARATISSVAENLQKSQQIISLPEPADVLSVLCSHHLLERIEYPSVAFRFAHQQYQEHYAAIRVKQILDSALAGGVNERRYFASECLNAPAWDEPVRMVAEVIGLEPDGFSQSSKPVGAGGLLVELAMECDLVFAAELFRLCGQSVRRDVGPAIDARLRSWLSVPDDHHQKCALTAILASGYDGFRDILIPVLSNPDSQVRLRTYRLRPGLQPSSIGDNWQEVVASWTEKARATFVSEILHDRYLPEVVEFVSKDRSTTVREAALHALAWNRIDDAASKLLEGVENPVFDAIVNKTPPDIIPPASRIRAIAAIRRISNSNPEPEEKLSALLRLAELGEAGIDNDFKSVLESLPAKPSKEWTQYGIQKALEILRKRHPVWVSEWVSTRIADNSLWPDQWMSFVTGVSPELLESCLKKLETQDFENGRIEGLFALVSAAADESVAARIFSGLRQVRKEIRSSTEDRRKVLWSIERQLETAFRKLPLDKSVVGTLSSLPGEDESIDVETVSQVFSRVARHDAEAISSINPELKTSLREFLKSRVEVVLAQDDFSGKLKADFASVLSQVGIPDDLNDLIHLINADVGRLRRYSAARNKGDNGPLVTGGGVTYASWNVRTLVDMNLVNVDSCLLDLLKEPEYERAVVEEIPKVLSTNLPVDSFGFGVNYEIIWEAREGRRAVRPDAARSRLYTTALREEIRLVMEKRRTSLSPDQLTNRLMAFAKSLAMIDVEKSPDVIFEILLLPGAYMGWQKEAILRAVIFTGGALPAEPTTKIIDSILQYFQRNGIHDNERDLIKRLLCILPFVTPAPIGIDKISEILSQPYLNQYDVDEIISALGFSRCKEAFDLLVRIITDSVRPRIIDENWINAVSRLDNILTKDFFMDFLEPGRNDLSNVIRHERIDSLAAAIHKVVKNTPAMVSRLYELCELDLPQFKRLLLAKVMSLLKTPESLESALKLIDDNSIPPVSFATLKQLEDAFVERKPYEHQNDAYTLSARASNSIRSRLFDMITLDPKRKRSAIALLGQIEEWRIEYGRPLEEPRHPSFGSPSPWPPMEVLG